jgi:hypothetical protein
MYFDDSLNLEGAGAGVLLISPTGEQLKYVLQIFWKVSNNEAEYEMSPRSTSDMSQLPILGPTDKSSAPTGWCSTLSKSGYTTLLTLKEAS